MRCDPSPQPGELEDCEDARKNDFADGQITFVPDVTRCKAGTLAEGLKATNAALANSFTLAIPPTLSGVSLQGVSITRNVSAAGNELTVQYSSSSTTSGNSHAFTLVELMLVVVLMGFNTVLGLSSYYRFMNDARLNSGGKAIAGWLDQIRRMAIQNSKTCTVKINPNSGTLELVTDVFFKGTRSEYTLSAGCSKSSCTVTDNAAASVDGTRPEGTNTLAGVEILIFKDARIDLDP